MRTALKFGIAALMGSLLFSQSASALSCARPDLVQVLEEVKASPKLYYVLKGRFEPLSRTYPRRRDGFESGPVRETPIGESAPTRFQGVSMGVRRAADQTLYGLPVTIQTSCAGPWCSSVPQTDTDVIAFVEVRSNQSLNLDIGPCPKYVFQASRENIQTVRRCLTRRCQPRLRTHN